MNAKVKTLLFILWMVLLSSGGGLFLLKGGSARDLVQGVRDLVESAGVWGPLCFVAVYSFRSLVFFPASALTVLSGAVFGPALGFLITLIGENISANLSFVIGRYFGAGMVRRLNRGSRMSGLACLIHRNGFHAVLTMRMMFLPFDLVGYSSGMCGIRHPAFALGTLLGTVPGLAAFVFLGSAVTDVRYLFVASAFMGGSLWMSRVLHRHEAVQPSFPNPQ